MERPARRESSLHATSILVASAPDVHCVAAADVDDTPNTAAIKAAGTPDSADGDDGDRVFLTGSMYHDGLNKNAWGLTEQGAREIADGLVGCDHVAAHPQLRGTQYDRAVFDGQGMPIGRVIDTGVTTAEQAMLDGGEYIATYTSEILDPVYKARYQAGLFDTTGYAVSVGIYGNPEEATCSVCRDDMAGCDHDRFDEVEQDGDTQVAGPLYDDGVSDHLASVYLPAYEGADAEVTAAEAGDTAPQQVPPAATVLGASHDPASDESDVEPSTDAASEDTDDDRAALQTRNHTRRVRVATSQAAQRVLRNAQTASESARERDSMPVRY